MCMGATKREGEWDDMTQLEAERLCDSRRDTKDVTVVGGST